jgi:purine-nucleoside phosphorylase
MSPELQYDYEDAAAAAGFIKARIGPRPRLALVTGTGLGDVAASLESDAIIDYREIPHFPVSTVQSHQGRLINGQMNGQHLLVLQGRFHLYEGYNPLAVTFPMRVLQALGIRYVVLTNAAGGLNPLFATGDIMIIDDHINLTGANPLVGSNEKRWGPRFVGMTHAYSGRLQDLAQSASDSLEVGVQKGVYVGLTGPSLETPAEMRFLRAVGADAVGFSTVLETIAATHAGMQVLGLSVITNMCLPDALTPVDVDEVIAAAQGAAPHLEIIIGHVLERLDKEYD